METKIKDDRLGLILHSLSFLLFIYIPHMGCKGGIAFC